MLWFYSTKKIFDHDKKINRQNDRWLCGDPSNVPQVMHTKFPATVMDVGGVNNKGHVMTPRVNASIYIGSNCETLDR